MKIGIIGLGMVGEAIAFGLRKIGHDVKGYDVDKAKRTHSWDDVLSTSIVFICVPTPSAQSGKCNTGFVEGVIYNLKSDRYPGLVVIKSTVPPGTTVSLQKSTGLQLVFCPEFLRERARFSDFYENHEVCIIGANSVAAEIAIRKAHGSIPKHFLVMTPTEAELAKYFVNCFNAYRINFANAFYDVCQAAGADYNKIKEAVTLRADTKSAYLDCNENLREFGGACLLKDTLAFMRFVSELGLCTQLFQNIVVENNRVTAGDIVQKARSA